MISNFKGITTQNQNYFKFKILERCLKRKSINRLLLLIYKYFPTYDGKYAMSYGKIINGRFKSPQVFCYRARNNKILSTSISALALINCNKLKEMKTLNCGNYFIIQQDLHIGSPNPTILDSISDVTKMIDIEFHVISVKTPLRIAIEPSMSYELSDLIEAFGKLKMYYPSTKIEIQESGVIFFNGNGEFALNLCLKEICDFFTVSTLKISEIFIAIRESITGISPIKCYGQTKFGDVKVEIITEIIKPNKKYINMLLAQQKSLRSKEFKHSRSLGYNYKLDLEHQKNSQLLAFKISNEEINVLTDARLFKNINQQKSEPLLNLLVNAFFYTCSCGPICAEPVINVNFKLLLFKTSGTKSNECIKEFLDVAKKVCMTSIILSKPRLLEPYYKIEILTPFTCIKLVFQLLKNRRAAVADTIPLQGTHLYKINALVPVIDSIGLECDLRYHSQGMATINMYFALWYKVPGNPLEKIDALTTDQISNLAGKYTSKIRKRKGLTETVIFNKIIPRTMIMEALLKEQ
mmetsp:Transcript_11067/g.15402  ORF Transcript_11067/g.15402 Transcript_11067/m.15402 type:complete len:522 (-) Transcript_11067:670-2235(-)